MYEDYYGFAEKPFSLTPDPKYLYKSESHANAFELMQYAIRRREGFVVITGDIGTGKTTLCRALLEQIDRKTFTALVLNPFLSEEDLLKLTLQDFGVISREEVKRGRLAGVSKQELIDALYDFLLGLLPLHANAVLIIDEAQNLPLQVLEQIRILSNLETDKEKLLQIVLVGQLNLQALLRSPELRQLDQRVSIRYELKPLTREEVAAYVAHRLTIAGGAATVKFVPKALAEVHRFSGGIPRLINLICDRALLGAYSVRSSTVTPDMVVRAAESLDLPTRPRSRFIRIRRRATLATTGALLLGVTAVGGVLTSGMLSKPAPLLSKLPASVKPAPAVPGYLAAQPVTGATDLAAVAPLPAPPPVPDMPTHRMPEKCSYTILVASFPTGGAGTSPQVTAVTQRLEALGYPVYHIDVDLGERGRWRRVLVGAYTSPDLARRDEKRLKQVREFVGAHVITSAFAYAGVAAVGSRQGGPQDAVRPTGIN